MAIIERKIGRTPYTFDEETGKKVAGKKTPESIARLKALLNKKPVEKVKKTTQEERRISGGLTGKTSKKLANQQAKKALKKVESDSNFQDAEKSNIAAMGPDAKQYKAKTNKKPPVNKRTTVKQNLTKKKEDNNKTGFLDDLGDTWKDVKDYFTSDESSNIGAMGADAPTAGYGSSKKKKEIKKNIHPTKKAIDKRNESLKTKRDSPHPEKIFKNKKKREIKGLIWDEKFGVYRDNYDQIKKAGGKVDWEKSKVTSDTIDGKKVGQIAKPGESLLDFNKRLDNTDFTEEDLEGEISDQDFANQKISDKQIDDHIGKDRKSKPLDIKTLDQARQESVQNLFNQMDSEEELYDQKQRMTDSIRTQIPSDPTSLLPQISKNKGEPKPQPQPQPQPSPENKFKAPEDDLTNEGDFEDEMRDAEEFGKLRVNKKDKKKILLAEDILRNRDKDSTARIRESTGDFYIDPFTGFALDMDVISRSNRRAEDMEIASMMPANKRAAFFYQKGIITKSDLDKLLEPTEMEQLQIDVQKAKLAESNLKQAKYKRETKDYLSPREKQKLDMYGANFRNAVTNDNIQGQIWWGKKLGMDVDKMIKDSKKVDKVPSDLSKHFEKKYAVKYDTVVKQRVDLYKQAAKVLQTGEIGDYQVGSKVVTSRKEFLRAQGLDDWTSPKLQKLRAEGNLEALKEYLSPERFPVLPKTEDGGVNYKAILKDADSFYQFVTQNFVHKQMNDYHPGGTYEAMIREYHQYLQSNPYYSKVKQ